MKFQVRLGGVERRPSHRGLRASASLLHPIGARTSSRVTAQRYYTVGRLVDALESDQLLVTFSDGGLLGRMEALHEIAQAPEEAWAPLAERLVAEKWRVSDARSRRRRGRAPCWLEPTRWGRRP